jgi:hypothetical protein
MLLAISHVIIPFAVEVSRDLDIEVRFRKTNLAAIVGAIPYGSATIMGLYERFHFPTLSARAGRAVRVFFGLRRDLLLSTSSRQYCHEQNRTNNRAAHVEQSTPSELCQRLA